MDNLSFFDIFITVSPGAMSSGGRVTIALRVIFTVVVHFSRDNGGRRALMKRGTTAYPRVDHPEEYGNW